MKLVKNCIRGRSPPANNEQPYYKKTKLTMKLKLSKFRVNERHNTTRVIPNVRKKQKNAEILLSPVVHA